MARPGDEDFVWSDFEDFSDFEDELEELEAVGYNAGDTSTEENATTSSPAGDESATTSGPAGDSGDRLPCSECARTFKYAGWLSRHMINEHGAQTTDTKEQGDGTTTQGDQQKEAKKPTRRLKIQRPTSNFTEEDAVGAGPDLLRQALEEAAKYPVWHVKVGKKPTPGNIAAQTTKELLETFDVSQHSVFVADLCRELWKVILSGDKSTLCSAAYEVMFAEYYTFCTGDSYKSMWTDFMHRVCKDPCPLLYQFVTRKIFEGLLKRRHIKDAPIPETANVDTKMSSEEEQVVRYIAGFIPYALLKKYRRFPNNNVAKLYSSVLKEWKVSSPSDSHSTDFLKYTEGWVNEVNRGGLFLVSNTVFIFFRHVENVVRCTANVEQLSQGKLKGLKDEITKNLESSQTVNHYWCQIASSHIPDEKLSKNLLEVVLQYYVNLRCRAFADAYIAVQRRKSCDFGSKKGEKSLRKSLDK